MTTKALLPTVVLTCGAILLCVVSVTCRADGLPVATGPQVVEGRKHPLTPEEQARKDHLREQRAKRWGIFMHYLIGGVATVNTGFSGLNLFAWGGSLFSSWLGWAWSVGMDLLLLALLAFCAVLIAGLYLAYRFVRWVFTPKGKSHATRSDV